MELTFGVLPDMQINWVSHIPQMIENNSDTIPFWIIRVQGVKVNEQEFIVD